MKNNLLVALIMVMSIPSLALASVRVPEPASMSLVGAGLVAVAIMRKKFKG